jgi:hypothetical protein
MEKFLKILFMIFFGGLWFLIGKAVGIRNTNKCYQDELKPIIDNIKKRTDQNNEETK